MTSGGRPISKKRSPPNTNFSLFEHFAFISFSRHHDHIWRGFPLLEIADSEQLTIMIFAYHGFIGLEYTVR